MIIGGIGTISNQYDAYIVDLWGVMHSGGLPFPRAIEALVKLKENDKKILFFSNAPRRASAVKDKIDTMVSNDLYDDIVTSGDILYDFLNNRSLSDLKTLGNYYYYVGPERDSGLLSGSDYQRVKELDNANFLLLTGPIHDDNNIEEHIPLLARSKALNLPVLCANPDLIVVKQTGEEWICAGSIAKIYEQMDGLVYQFGKPFVYGYEICMKKFDIQDKKKVLAIGDSIATDITGASNFGIDSVFIIGGIHRNAISDSIALPLDKEVDNFLKRYDLFPSYVMKELNW
jgi:HAD superfamily hydrolase (TIGR01459 family)